jgi:hypothetical protein
VADLYRLVGHQTVLCRDAREWGAWFESADRTVARTYLEDGSYVSTVFLGIDHSFGLSGEPVLFETMVFGGPQDEEMERYRTWEEAERGHDVMVRRVLEVLGLAKGDK